MAKYSVLVIEDNLMNQVLVRDILEMDGYEVFLSDNASSGIEMARKHMPSLILMDIQLPGMDGLSATRILTNDPELGSIPVVARTSHSMNGDEEKAREAGCCGYITKPIDVKTFTANLLPYFEGADGAVGGIGSA